MNAISASSTPSEPFADLYAIADAVLYEGYALYPYRASSLKNRVRWNFGGIYPKGYSAAQTGTDAHEVGSECLLRGDEATLLVEVRFLELLSREPGAPSDEARAHGVRCDLGPISRLIGTHTSYAFARGHLRGALEVWADRLPNSSFRLHLRLRNESADENTERARALP
ncbi:MAG TPA: hypothetical protein VGM44_10600, partial [Polyangiaceae bacterium]